MINIFGGKITTYRKLSEAILEHIEGFLGKQGNPWTETSSLPGGEFKISMLSNLESNLQKKYNFLSNEIIKRLIRSYGQISFDIFGDCQDTQSLGEHFGAGLYEIEVIYLLEKEWAKSSNDILFRRSKLGLSISDKGLKKLDLFIKKYNEEESVKVNNTSAKKEVDVA